MAALGNYGGATQTMPPLPGSPAIGAGSVAANTFATDQRGYPRTQNGLMDIGAVELPTIRFTASTYAGFVSLNVQFTSPAEDSEGSPITQWNWNFGDNATSTNESPAHIYITGGTNTPSLTVTNSLGLALGAAGPGIITYLPPVIYMLSLSETNLVLNVTNGHFGMTYYTLMSTNLALPRSQWTPVATNVRLVSGNFTVTNSVNSSVPKQFYMLQLP